LLRNMGTENQDARSTRRFIIALAILAAAAAVLFYVVATLQGREGHAAMPSLGALRPLAQAADAETALGTPSRPMPTLRLYPALIRTLRNTGLRDAPLLEVMFAVNIVFFVLFSLASFWATHRLFPTAAAGVALALTLNGNFIGSAMSLTDTGLFLWLLASLLAAIVSERPWMATLALGLLVWSRPEGILIALGILFGAARLRVRREFGSWRWLVCGVAGLAISLYFLAAPAMFSRLRGPNAPSGMWLNSAVWPGTYAGAVARLAAFVQHTLFNISRRPFEVALAPVLGGLLALFGLCAADWQSDVRTRPLLGGVLLAAFTSLGLATFPAQSAARLSASPWFLAIWTAAAVLGARRLADFFPQRRYVYPLLLASLIGYELAALPHFVKAYAASCASTQATTRLLQTLHQEWPPDLSVGLVSDDGLRYLFPGRTVRLAVNPADPLFAGLRDPAFAIEIYKHNPQVRFDYWILHNAETSMPLVAHSLGKRIIPAHDDGLSVQTDWVVHKADWTSFAAPFTPRAANACDAVKSLRLIARMDVGYPPHERDLRYHVLPRLRGTAFAPLATARPLGGQRIVETGDMVIGSDEFSLAILPNRPLRIVLRTASYAPTAVAQTDGYYPNEKIVFQSSLRIMPVVNGRPMEHPLELVLDPDADSFSEVVFDIPADYLPTDRAHIRIIGDRVACAYWFYQ
jgi:hypothetical protein